MKIANANFFPHADVKKFLLKVSEIYPPRFPPSGVVGRERMGTAYLHKKLSGNGVPTREILRDIFGLLLLN